jgi:hypothetical protein
MGLGSKIQSVSLRIRTKSKAEDNKAIVRRWFTQLWGKTLVSICGRGAGRSAYAPAVFLHKPRRGHEDIKNFVTGPRKVFPVLNFTRAADLIAEGARGRLVPPLHRPGSQPEILDLQANSGLAV